MEEPRLCLWVRCEDTGKRVDFRRKKCDACASVRCSCDFEVLRNKCYRVSSLASALKHFWSCSFPPCWPIEHPYVTWFRFWFFSYFVLLHCTRFHFYIQLQGLEVFLRVLVLLFPYYILQHYNRFGGTFHYAQNQVTFLHFYNQKPQKDKSAWPIG